MTVLDVKKNITTIFIVPTLKIGRDVLKSNQFINGYIKDVKRDVQYENAVYLLFRPNNLDIFHEFLEKEKARTEQVITDDYDYEGGWVVVVYSLNKDFTNDFKLIKQGKYSKTSKRFQEQFPKVIKIIKNGLHKDEFSLQHRVFNKTEDLKLYWEEKLNVAFTDDMELWDWFSEENESLNIDKIKEYV